MLFLCYPKCSTCRKAWKWLDEKGVQYEMRDIKTDNPSADELKKWHELSGLPLKKFFNTSGNLYKQMNLKDRLADMSEEEQFSLLASDGMLVKRPILVDGGKVLVGFKEKEWEETFA
ncbi:arsenate reductase family protein [Ruminococcus sp. CLA-AA-H200]|uniref:Arsenate reductase family protein n=1 Tax=Ruminococcus turbiniformis TaxID=2881258 RepID=A0ABS8FZE1_9FIRM|nr:arsenate reductase family protein [Ruminococcus turbiniformis]MCC2254054.1 arsenate reductase family protein [Ruminococcus turbiniformis]